MPTAPSLFYPLLHIHKSARLTKMYVFTDGLNYGAARIIGEVVAHEKMREGAYDLREVGHIKAIGVVSCDQLSYGQAIEETPVTKVKKAWETQSTLQSISTQQNNISGRTHTHTYVYIIYIIVVLH